MIFLQKVANIIFLDQPAGSGFSYGKTPEAYIMNDTLSVIHTYDFLKKWLVDHPGFLSNPLYLGGDSYSGILVPMIAQEIYDGTHKFLISIELLVQKKR
ncbi:putative sinapoylglucose--sinapoylglucose O-sinapoyltransferase [Helianthus debilis subsp. tardiflorus]